MPTDADPSDWIVKLLQDKWSQAVESLRGDGVQIKTGVPIITASKNRDSTQRINERVLAKVFSTGDEEHVYVTHGDLDDDVSQSWSVQLEAWSKADGVAARLIHDAQRVLVRLLQLYRSNPHPDWHRLESIRVVRSNDFPDYQRRRVQFTLRRYGEILPTSVRQVT